MSNQVTALRFNPPGSQDIFHITHCQLNGVESVPVEEVIQRLEDGEEFFMIGPQGQRFPISIANELSHLPTDDDPARILRRTITAGEKLS